MKVFLSAFFFFVISSTSFAQVDGYLSETGTNGSELIKKNNIKKEIRFKKLEIKGGDFNLYQAKTTGAFNF